jgi:transcriptional regulator of arginine metabolism
MTSLGQSRLQALKALLEEAKTSTQDELREELERLKFSVTQSTISRDLRRIGAIRTIDSQGRVVYRLMPSENAPLPVGTGNSLQSLVHNIKSNGSIIVITTLPGSASLIARHLDHIKPAGILGTIAGDDTIFVAPSSVTKIMSTIRSIESCLNQ